MLCVGAAGFQHFHPLPRYFWFYTQWHDFLYEFVISFFFNIFRDNRPPFHHVVIHFWWASTTPLSFFFIHNSPLMHYATGCSFCFNSFSNPLFGISANSFWNEHSRAKDWMSSGWLGSPDRRLKGFQGWKCRVKLKYDKNGEKKFTKYVTEYFKRPKKAIFSFVYGFLNRYLWFFFFPSASRLKSLHWNIQFTMDWSPRQNRPSDANETAQKTEF